MGIKYEIVAKVGTYIDRDGKEKGEYVNMGNVIESQSGSLVIKVKSIPVGWDGWAYLNTPKEKNQTVHDDDDNIPF